jgi:subtilisin family serine protease
LLATILGLLCLASLASAQDFVPGEVIVKLKSGQSSVRAAQFSSRMRSRRMNLKASFRGMNISHYKLQPGQDLTQALKDLRNDPDVEYAEPNYILHVVDDAVAQSSNYYAYGSLGYYLNPNYSDANVYSQNAANVKVPQSWNIETPLANNSERPIVAIVDTGVDYNHSVFINSGAIWTNPNEIPANGIDDDGNGYIDDVRGWNFYAGNNNPMDDASHGTHVAGIVLGVGQNIFASSIAPAKIRIMPLKFMGADGTGSTAAAISAIYYAVNNGAQVINNSWGGSSYSQALADALVYAYDHSVFIASAAGNNSQDLDSNRMYPASYEVSGQMAVAATTDYDYLASFSNYGVGSVHVASPGYSVWSTLPNNTYGTMSGTSMATPFVSGLAALVMREAPNLTGFQVKDLLMSSADSIPALNGYIYSAGRVDAYAAIAAAQSEVGESSYQPTQQALREPAGAASAASTAAAGCGTVGNMGDGSGGGGHMSGVAILLTLAFAFMPLLTWILLIRRSAGKNRRRYERFVMNSDIKVMVGGRELTAHLNTISEGGLSFNADALIERGGLLTMNIASPDGGEVVQVQGHVVWSESNKAYGVQFDEAKESVLSSIRAWTVRLVKAQ